MGPFGTKMGEKLELNSWSRLIPAQVASVAISGIGAIVLDV
jgi:hypothetical protein